MSSGSGLGCAKTGVEADSVFATEAVEGIRIGHHLIGALPAADEKIA